MNFLWYLLTWNGFVALSLWGWALQSCHLLLFNCSAFVPCNARIQQWWKLLVEDALITASQNSGELYILCKIQVLPQPQTKIRQHWAFSFSHPNHNLVLLQHTSLYILSQDFSCSEIFTFHYFHFHFLHPNFLLQKIDIWEPEEPVKFVSNALPFSPTGQETSIPSIIVRWRNCSLFSFVHCSFWLPLISKITQVRSPKKSICISKWLINLWTNRETNVFKSKLTSSSIGFQ